MARLASLSNADSILDDRRFREQAGRRTGRPVTDVLGPVLRRELRYETAVVGILPAALFAISFIVALAAVTALSVGVVMALAKFVGPLAAGAIGLLLFAAIAGGLGWYAVERVKRAL